MLTLFDAYDNGSGPSFLLALPEIAWEASLAIYCAWKGFRPIRIPDTDWRRVADGRGRSQRPRTQLVRCVVAATTEVR